MYEINVTLACNWKCDYCSMKERLNAKTDWNKIINLAASVPRGSALTISGGEPGLLPRYRINELLGATSNLNLMLNTNGEFIKRYPDLVKKFARINLHVDIGKPILRGSFNYVLIATKTNQAALYDFCLENKDLKFDIIPSSHNDFSVNQFTCKNINSNLYKFMTKESLAHYFLGDRYVNTIYLN